jgi:hypothetical protein
VLPRQSQSSFQAYMIEKVVEQLPPSLMSYYQQERAKYRKTLWEA